jgi:chromosome segregation ATPase
LEDLKDKAEGELSEARKAESTALHNFKMMKQSLDDQMAFDTKNMDEEKAGKEEAMEGKATAEGDLETTVKALKESEKALEVAQSDCMTTASDHEATVASRKEELKVLAEAEKILKGSTSGAEEITYSFLQVSSASKAQSRVQLANTEVLNMVKKLARDHHSAALAQLASRIAVVVRYGGKNGGDPFAKVKGMISDMISKLEKEAEAEATEKAYCDEEMAKTSAKKEDLEDAIADLTSKIDKAAAATTALKEEVVELQKELVALAKEQAEMDEIRAEQHAAYKVAKAELTEGLAGVRKALDMLREYYGNDAASSFAQQPAKPETFEKSEGAGGSIIDILEVTESDFATNLAKEESQESDSAEAYEKQTQENKILKATKDQDVKYKTQEAIALDKTISELTGDKETASTELAAVDEYFAKIKERCIAKPESYEERKARRDAEIEGLKEALSILENADAFVQVARKGGKSKHMMI